MHHWRGPLPEIFTTPTATANGSTACPAATPGTTRIVSIARTSVRATSLIAVPSLTCGLLTRYDDDGVWVNKVVPGTGETTIFASDDARKQIAEYSTVIAEVDDAKPAYLTNDHQGI